MGGVTGGAINLDRNNSVEHLAMWLSVGTYGYLRARNEGLSQTKSCLIGVGAGAVATGLWEGVIEPLRPEYAETIIDKVSDIIVNTGGSVLGVQYGMARQNYLERRVA